MKRCPVCNTAYTDDTLSFCLSDGNPLDKEDLEQETVVRNIGTGAPRTESRPIDETWVMPSKGVDPAKASFSWLKIVIAGIVLLLLVVGGLGLTGVLIYFGQGREPNARIDPTPTPGPARSPSPDTEKEKLLEEIANIRRQLDEQKKESASPDNQPDDEPASEEFATVNSPNDGFLALRSLPDSERGIRLAKIPHGHELEIIDCEAARKSISGRSGRWCLAEYNGIVGWVFDAWLTR